MPQNTRKDGRLYGGLVRRRAAGGGKGGCRQKDGKRKGSQTMPVHKNTFLLFLFAAAL